MRQPRKLIPGVTYHVVARANRHEFIFNNEQMKSLFLDVVRRARTKYSFTLRNFCIMSNHIHFLIQPGKGESLSRIMQWILSVFAIAFNRTYGYNGHVWYDRFKSVVIGTLRQFIAAFEYIATNPVKAGMATDAMKYRYNGVRHIRDGDRSVVAPADRVVQLLFPGITAIRLAGPN